MNLRSQRLQGKREVFTTTIMHTMNMAIVAGLLLDKIRRPGLTSIELNSCGKAIDTLHFRVRRYITSDSNLSSNPANASRALETGSGVDMSTPANRSDSMGYREPPDCRNAR